MTMSEDEYQGFVLALSPQEVRRLARKGFLVLDLEGDFIVRNPRFTLYTEPNRDEERGDIDPSN